MFVEFIIIHILFHINRTTIKTNDASTLSIKLIKFPTLRLAEQTKYIRFRRGIEIFLLYVIRADTFELKPTRTHFSLQSWKSKIRKETSTYKLETSSRNATNWFYLFANFSFFICGDESRRNFTQQVSHRRFGVQKVICLQYFLYEEVAGTLQDETLKCEGW